MPDLRTDCTTPYAIFVLLVSDRSGRASRAPAGRERDPTSRPAPLSSELRPLGGATCLCVASVRPACEHVFVRWDNLKIEAEEGTRLPGYRDPAVVRRFDAPEALDVRFYEVRSKSVLNRVPEASRDAVPLDDQPVPGLHATPACTASRARPTPTSTWTRGATSSARSS